MVPRGAEEGPKSDLQRQVERTNAPRRAQDRLGPAKGAIRRLFPHPQGTIWEPKTTPNSTPKRSKIEAEIDEAKTSIQDDLGPFLERSRFVWGRQVEAQITKKCWKTYYFVTNHFFEDNTVRRRIWDQLGAKKAPKGRKMTPKRDPNRAQSDPKSTSKSS